MKQRVFKANKTPKPHVGNNIPFYLFSKRDLEIGSGTGEFSLNRARMKQDTQIIAIEKTRNKIKKALSIKQKSKNLWLLHTNAVWWIAHFIPEGFINNIFILYPNIYSKNKQTHLRWINRPFMLFLLQRLKIGGQIEIRTNHFPYYEEVKDKFLNHYIFMKNIKNEIIKEGQGETSFERKYLKRMPCFKGQWKKIF